MDDNTLLLLLKAVYRSGQVFLTAIKEIIRSLEKKGR